MRLISYSSNLSQNIWSNLKEKWFEYRILRPLLYFLITLLVVFIVGIPLLYMMSSSFKPEPEMYKVPPAFFPSQWTVEGYGKLISYSNIPVAFRNSVIVCTLASVLGVGFSITFTYTLTRFRLPGMKYFIYLMLFVYMLPKVLLMIPIYGVFARLDLTTGLVPLTLTYTSATLPFAIWLLRSYFAGIPLDLEEAALVDGATRVQAFLKIILPLAHPGIIATLIFTLILSWNEVLYASIFAPSQSNQVLSSALANLLLAGKSGWMDWGLVNAAAVVTTLPMVILFMLVQRQLVSGFTAGGVKG